MSTLGKGVKSIRKQDLNTQKSFGVGVKKLVFYQNATAGDTGINLFSLTIPSSISSIGKTNPSAAAISTAKLYYFQDNFTLFSSLRGWLMPGSFVIASSSQINFVGFTAADNEIFIGYLDNIIQPSLHAADVNPINATGTLAVGTTDFAVSPFTANVNPLTQLGSVLVFRNGKLQMRNTNNATAAPGADGNYQEVPSSGGLSSTIRFNIAAPGPNADAIVVCANGALIEQPTDSQMAYIEVLAGQINSMIPVLADAAGVPTSTFGSNPSSVDLRTYGAQVISNTNLLAKAPTLTTLTSGSGTYTPPSGAVYLKIKMVGGGGGGGGGGNPGNAGGVGASTTFGTATAAGGLGGGGGILSASSGGAGGSATLGAGMTGIAIPGGSGSGNGNPFGMMGALGASSPFGGAGGGGNSGAGLNVAKSNSGSGGGGGQGNGSNYAGSGGGAGGYIDAVISAPSGSFAYSIGTGGTGGTGASDNGGNGGSGVIIIEEHYSG